jgi:hypothetical protein
MLEARKAAQAGLLKKAKPGLQLNEHIIDVPSDIVFRHACMLGPRQHGHPRRL